MVRQQFLGPEYEVKIDRYFKNPIAARYPDITVLFKEEAKQCSEVKTGDAPTNRRQERVDSWIHENKCPVEFVRYPDPGCPVNLSEYTNCRVQ